MRDQLTELVKQYFPHDKFNPGQAEAIIDAVIALKKGTKHVVIEAPTGTGKSAIAVTINNIMLKLDRWHRTTLITQNLGLQDQYISDYGVMTDLKGKTNYKCSASIDPDVFYSTGKCKLLVNSGQCSGASQCPYVTRRDEWLNKSQFRLSNSAFVIKASYEHMLSGERFAPLMIIDECHELSTTLINHSTLKLNRSSLNQVARTYGEGFAKLFGEVFDVLRKIGVGTAFKQSNIDIAPIRRFYNQMSTLRDNVLNELKDGSQDSTLMILNDELQDLLFSMETFVTLSSGEWILTEFEENKKEGILKCAIKPVYAHQVSKAGIFCKADQFIHMSATICGFEEYCYNLGIGIKDAVYIQVENPIPADNRKIIIHNKISVNKNTPGLHVAKMVDEVITKNNYTSNGVIHTVSFKLAETIKELSKYNKRMHISNDRKEILELLNKQVGNIILSPSIMTGYDFKGDLARWQIIAKVPYLFLGDPYVKLNCDRDNVWYARQAILNLVQASGRVVRGMGDFGVTEIIDGNVLRLLKYNSNLVPDWYIDSLNFAE